jgi:hypothetical protein
MHPKPLLLALATLTTFGGLSTAADNASGVPVRVIPPDGPDREGKQPQVAVDQAGRIYVAFGVGRTVRLAVSTDRGESFQVSTVGTAGSLALGMRRGPRVVVTGDSVVVTAIGGEKGKGQDGDVLAWRSTDTGKTWAGPTQVNSVECSAREGLHGMASGPDGKIFCTWLDLRDKRTEIYGAMSKDGGKTWEPDSLVYRSPEKSVCECCHPSAAFDPDGTLRVMWRNSLVGKRDLYLASSSDGGKTFRPAEKLGKGTWTLNACPMDGGALAVLADGQVETVWMRAGTMYAARPNEPERELGRGVQGWTAAGPGGAYSVWLEKRPGRVMAVTPTGGSPMTLADHAGDPVIAAAPGGRSPVVAVWESKSGKGGIFAQVLTASEREAAR